MIVVGIVLNCVVCGVLFRFIVSVFKKCMKRGIVICGFIMKVFIVEKER